MLGNAVDGVASSAESWKNLWSELFEHTRSAPPTPNSFDVPSPKIVSASEVSNSAAVLRERFAAFAFAFGAMGWLCK